MSLLDELPTEILESIIEDEAIDCGSFCRFASTCSRFHEIGLNSNDVWRKKLRSQFPGLYKWYPRQKHLEINWRDQCKQRFQIGTIIMREVAHMSSKFHQKDELSNEHFSFLDDLLLEPNPAKSYLHLHIIDELSCIIHGNPRHPVENYHHKNLTLKFYARKAMKHIKHRIFKPTWIRQEWLQSTKNTTIPVSFMAGISLESSMIKIAQWCQPTEEITENDIIDQFDKFAVDILQDLSGKYPDHPIFKAIKEQNETTTSSKPILLPIIPQPMTQSVWSPVDSRRILESANHHLYQVVQLSGNTENYYSAENSFINKILETKSGIPITMCILYASVLARLGVFCEPVNFPNHFLLRFMEHPQLMEKEEDRYTYIDAFQNGKLMTSLQAKELLHRSSSHLVLTAEHFQATDTMAVTRRMLRNLISIGASRANNMRDPRYSLLRNSLELMLILEDSNENVQYAFMLSRVYLELSINQEEVLRLLEKYKEFPGISSQVKYLQQACQTQIDARIMMPKINDIKTRNTSLTESPGGPFFSEKPVQFWIGMVAKHRKYNYTCIIYGWDPVCTATQSWIYQMGVHELPRQDKQPFYNVLVDDGSNRYAADENLEYINPVEVTHDEIGRYFEEFCPKKGYIPNDEKKMEYPEDQAIMEVDHQEIPIDEDLIGEV